MIRVLLLRKRVHYEIVKGGQLRKFRKEHIVNSTLGSGSARMSNEKQRISEIDIISIGISSSNINSPLLYRFL